GLTGRGGAGFPAADKLAAIAGRPDPAVIARGTSAEPMSAKDRALLRYAPQLVLDGATLVAQVLGAREALIVAPADTLGDVHAAIAQRDNVCRNDGVALRPVASAPGYVGGEETALIAHLEGRPARPRVKPPLAV